jgi:hypothetical protein
MRAIVGGSLLLGVAATIVLLVGPALSGSCDPIWALPDPTRHRNVGYLRTHNFHTSGNLNLEAAAVTAEFVSVDPRNFATEVSLADYAVAMSIPLTDEQSEFYGAPDPNRRIIVVVSYGHFDYPLANGFAAQQLPEGGVHVGYQVRAAALDAHDGSVLSEPIAVCR